MSKTKSLLAVAVALLVFLAYSLWTQLQRVNKLGLELEVARASARSAHSTVEEYYALAAADSLLFSGRQAEAMTAYLQLASDTTKSFLYPSVQREIDRRLTHLNLLGAYARELDTLRALAGRPRAELTPLPVAHTPVASVAPLALERARPGDYDSLTFALRKADMRIRNLESRLTKSSGGNYLTFASGQGNEVYYVGDVQGGKANGRGVALLSSGSRYAGEWRDNKRHGQGTFHWSDGAYYEGEFFDDQRDGTGTYHFPSGEVFIGDWENDLRNGRGTVYDKDGNVVAEGQWEDDELVDAVR